MEFITDKGKWIFHSFPFSINIGQSAFSYILGKGLVQCSEYALNYLDYIMGFFEIIIIIIIIIIITIIIIIIKNSFI